MYRIGISGSYGGLNLGDEAILEGIVQELRASIPCEISVYTRNEEDTLGRHDVDRAVAIQELTLEEAAREIKRLDAFVLGGGGILYDRDAEAYLREVRIAGECKVPVMVYAVSAGPLKKASIREVVQKRLNEVAVITVRDRQGKRLLEDLGVQKEITVTADPALLLRADGLPGDVLEREGLDTDRRIVGFSVREPGPAAPDIDVEHYHALLANAADFVIDRLNADVFFVPMEHRKMDIQHSHAVISMMHFADRATVLKGEYSSRQLIALISHFEFGVGMRLHFLIFAALANVPFVALPYASKVTGLIEDLQMEMPPLRDVNTGRLIAAIDRSWDHRHTIRKKIQKALPALQERAGRTNQLLLELLSTTAEQTGHSAQHAHT